MVCLFQDRSNTNPMMTTGTLTFNIQDVNDQPPMFDQTLYQYDIFENATKVLEH